MFHRDPILFQCSEYTFNYKNHIISFKIKKCAFTYFRLLGDTKVEENLTLVLQCLIANCSPPNAEM